MSGDREKGRRGEAGKDELARGYNIIVLVETGSMDHHRGGDHAVKLMPSAYQWPDTSAPKVPRFVHSGVGRGGHVESGKVDRAYIETVGMYHNSRHSDKSSSGGSIRKLDKILSFRIYFAK